MIRIKCSCLVITAVLVRLLGVDGELTSIDASTTLILPRSETISESLTPLNRSQVSPDRETTKFHLNDPSDGRGLKRRKNFVRMLIQAKMVAAAVFIPGIIALSLFASWKSALFSIVACVVAAAALLRPHHLGGREYSHADHNPPHALTQASPPWPQRVSVNEYGHHKALLHVVHHGGKKEDHRHDHHVWYHDSPTSSSPDHYDHYNGPSLTEESYDPYHGWSSR